MAYVHTMQEWIWIGLYLLLITAVQLLVYRRLKNGSQPRGVPLGRSRGVDQGEFNRTDRLAEPDDLQGETRQCPACGARNAADTVFSRCWNCASRL